VGGTEDLTILVPVYNDWESFGELVSDLDETLRDLNKTCSILAVDDCSVDPFDPELFDPNSLKRITWMKVIHLHINMGHQRAIAVGLAYVHDHFPKSAVIVMDADGEDTPAEITKLLFAHGNSPQKIILAKRAHRSEGFWFRLFYHLYKLLFSILTGREITFGNFSLLPQAVLPKLVRMPEVWNHYAGALLKSKLPRKEIPINRGSRYFGKSKMRFADLVLHGLSAISIYLEMVIVRMLIASMSVIGLAFFGFLVVVYIRFFTDLAIPGWATNLTIGLAMVVIQAVILLTLLTFVVLNQRSSKQVIPAKDYPDFIFKTETLMRGMDG